MTNKELEKLQAWDERRKHREKKTKQNKSKRSFFQWVWQQGVNTQVYRRAGGKCEVCGFAVSDVLEAHHIIPLEELGEFDNRIESAENIALLCPNCHALVTKLRRYSIDSLRGYTTEQIENLHRIARTQK